MRNETGGVLIEVEGDDLARDRFLDDLASRPPPLARIDAVRSVTEGDDKPLKYPHMFRACTFMVLDKIDFLPYAPFDEARFLSHARLRDPRRRPFRVV